VGAAAAVAGDIAVHGSDLVAVAAVADDVVVHTVDLAVVRGADLVAVVGVVGVGIAAILHTTEINEKFSEKSFYDTQLAVEKCSAEFCLALCSTSQQSQSFVSLKFQDAHSQCTPTFLPCLQNTGNRFM